MFSKKALLFALLSLSVSVQAAAASKNKSVETCQAGTAKTVTVTATVAAAASTSTAVLAANPNKGGKGTTGKTGTAAGNNAGAGKTGAAAGNNAGAGKAGTGKTATTSTAKAATSTGTAAGNNAGAGKAAGNGNTGSAAAAGGDAQTSLTLVQSVIATGFANDGQDVPAAGQVASATSTNNFINFCATVPNLPITNGKQVTTGSCNPAPMGIIASTANMPSAKFVNPKNGATIAANTNFTVQMAISHLETGHFTNAQENYFAAPQVINGAGDVQGHSHVVIEQLTSLDQTTVTDPSKFAFFKGLNDPAKNGVLSVEVAGGLPAGFYRIASINSAANHQPVLVAIAQHGSLDDMAYFTVA